VYRPPDDGFSQRAERRPTAVTGCSAVVNAIWNQVFEEVRMRNEMD